MNRKGGTRPCTCELVARDNLGKNFGTERGRGGGGEEKIRTKAICFGGRGGVIDGGGNASVKSSCFRFKKNRPVSFEMPDRAAGTISFAPVQSFAPFSFRSVISPIALPPPTTPGGGELLAGILIESHSGTIRL